MNKKDCELCNFDNPKGTSTAVILNGNRLLVLKRNDEPFMNMWDLPGGYMNRGEDPEDTMRRELKEELGVDAKLNFLGCFPGTATWKDRDFAILSHAYLAEINGEINLDKEENSAFKWVSLSDIKQIAFDSNEKILEFCKKNFLFDLERVKFLVHQLDNTAVVNEYSLYRAKLDGYVSRQYDGDKLIGMGWIFPRQTALRKQAVVEDMIVDEEYRGRGLGKALLDDVVRWAARQGVEMIELTSNPARIAANELYKKYGFKLHPTNHYLYKIN